MKNYARESFCIFTCILILLLKAKVKYCFVAVPMRRDVERGWGGPTGMSSVEDVMYFSSYYVFKVALWSLGWLECSCVGISLWCFDVQSCIKDVQNCEKNAEKSLSIFDRGSSCEMSFFLMSIELIEILHFARSCTSGHTYIATVAFLPGALM